MNLDNLTIGEFREIANMIGCRSREVTSPVSIGDKVLIRTVTYHMLGRVADIRGSWVLLEESSWVASSGQWGKAIANGVLSEVEVGGTGAWVNLDTAVDIHPWNHDLPTETK